MSRLSMRRNNLHPEDASNPLVRIANLGKSIFKAGLQLCWQVHSAQLLDSHKECSAFVLKKILVDKSGKKRKRDINFDTCRKEIENLRKLQHKRILTIFTEAEETSFYLSWISEPLLGTLQSLFEKSTSGNLPRLELEIILGVFQVTDALRYLHATQNLMHCNICPTSVFITVCSQWKLGGFSLMEPISNSTKIKPQFTGYNPKSSHHLQPNLDFIAPEVQVHHAMSPLADIFSLGMVICCVYNGGVSLLQSDNSISSYVKQVPHIPEKFHEISHRFPKQLVEPVRKMISQDVRERPTAQLLALLKIFNEPSLLSYEGLLTLPSRPLNQKKEFFNRFSKAIPEFDEPFRYKKVLPHLWNLYENHSELQSFILPSILTMAHIAKKEDFDEHIRGGLYKLLHDQKTKQTTLVSLDLVEFFIKYLNLEEIVELVLPDIDFCLKLTSPKAMETVRNAVEVIYHYLGPEEVEINLYPILKDAINSPSTSIMVQITAMDCIDSLLGLFRPSFVTKELLPFLALMQPTDSDLVLTVANIFQKVLCDNKFRVPYTIIGTKLLPPFIPMLISKTLTLNQFRSLMVVVQLMLDIIDQDRSIEYSRKKSLSADEGILNMSSRVQPGNSRNLPLISMQQPTIDFSRISPGCKYTANFRPRSHSSDTNTFSIGNQSSASPWSSSRQFLNRLRASSQCSETMFRKGSGDFGGLSSGMPSLRPQDKTHSNPNFGQRLSLNLLQKTSRAASWNNSVTAISTLDRRRSSGGATNRLSDRYGYLNVTGGLTGGGIGDGVLDPRRHSYGCSPTASANSLLTGGVCEGPFSSPMQSNTGSRRPSTLSFNQTFAPNQTPTSLPRENVFSKIVANLFS